MFLRVLFDFHTTQPTTSDFHLSRHNLTNLQQSILQSKGTRLKAAAAAALHMTF